jgi:indolepyruvate decarboxylase
VRITISVNEEILLSKLTSQTAVITGRGSGLGLSTAERWVSEGALQGDAAGESIDRTMLQSSASFTIGDYLLQRLREVGVRHMFGVPGDFNLWFLEQSITGGQVEFVGCCNELNASYAADGAARLAGISALATTYGVGELSSLAGVAGAYAEQVPVVCITGTPPLNSMKKGALLHHTLADGNFTNMMNCYREFTVAQARIEPVNARREIDRVLRACLLEKRPVYIQLPSDIAGIATEPITEALDLRLPSSDPEQLRQAISRIVSRVECAENPMILLDAAADRFALTDLLLELSEKYGIPVSYLVTAKGVVSEEDPRSIGIYAGAGSARAVREAVEAADCLICVGTRFSDVATGLFSHNLDAATQINVEPYGVTIDGETLSAVYASEVLAGVLRRPDSARNSRGGFHPSIQPAVSSETDGNSSQTSSPVTQVSFWRSFQNYLRTGDVIVADTGTSFFSSVELRLPDGVTFIGQPIWAALGYALPATVGACLTAPGRRHILLVGDGALQMTVQELSTFFRHDLKPIIFLLNNDGYTIERLIYGAQSSYNNIHPWRYGMLPRIFDEHDRSVVHRVGTIGDLEEALARTNDIPKLHFIEVVLPRLDAPESLMRIARRAAEFDFPQIRRLSADGNSRNSC